MAEKEDESAAELLKSTEVTPGRLSPGDIQREPGEAPTTVVIEPVVSEDELPPRLPMEREAEAALRRVHIRRNVELWKYSFERACRGCMAAETGRAPENHSEACRQRIESAMEADGVSNVRGSR